MPVGYLKGLAAYWWTGYDWREHEGQLNRLPQFTTTIDGASLHFIHARSPEAGAVPLLLIHGWPGSVVEFLSGAGGAAARSRGPRGRSGGTRFMW